MHRQITQTSDSKKMHGISGWHNISANLPSIDVNKITFEDLVSIINSLKKKVYNGYKLVKDETDGPEIKDFDDLKQMMYDHILDLGTSDLKELQDNPELSNKEIGMQVEGSNPHEVTIDQLPEQVIDIFYEKWLSEGYYGSKQQFIDTLFRYIVFSTWDHMLDGVDRDIAVTVKDFYTYLIKHDTDTVDIHTPLLDSIFKAKPGFISPPILTYSKVGGIPYTVEKCLNPYTNKYENIPLSSLTFPDKATIFLHGVYTSGQWLFLRNESTSTKFISVDVDAENNKVLFSTSNRNIFPVTMTMDITNLVTEANIKKDQDKITITVEFDGNRLVGHVQLTGNFMQIPVKSSLLPIDGTIYRYPEEPRHPYNTLMTIPRMNRTDFLEEVSIYPFILNATDLSFVFNIFD